MGGIAAGDIVRGAIRRSRTTQRAVARLIGITDATMTAKCKAGTFTLPEIRRMSKVIAFTDDECRMLVRGVDK